MEGRGKPTRIYSDNGTNLKGASEELRKVVLSLDKDEILRQTSNEKLIGTRMPLKSVKARASDSCLPGEGRSRASGQRAYLNLRWSAARLCALEIP